MATRSRKKPAKRKSKPASGNRTLTTFGWLAAAAVGCGWAASDGRPARYASAAFDAVRQTVRPADTVDRVAALIQNEPKRSAFVTTAPARSHPALSYAPIPEDRTGSIRPRARPPADVVAQEAQRVPLPTKAPLLPLAAPPMSYAMREVQPAPQPPATNTSTVEERHATRPLAAHAAPNASSPSTNEIASGSSVVVLRSAGDWRYVRDERSGTEGWVDGRFLAGQSMAADVASISHDDLTRRP